MHPRDARITLKAWLSDNRERKEREDNVSLPGMAEKYTMLKTLRRGDSMVGNGSI